MATMSEKAQGVANDPERRYVWVIVVTAVLILIIIGRGFRSR